MIKNEREYKITKASVARFKRSLTDIAKLKKDKKYDSAKLKLQEQAMSSIMKDLQQQVREFEQLRTAKFSSNSFDYIEAIPRNLIRARVALGWTQKELANRLGTTEQQIQKYESTEYESASLGRILKITTILKEEHGRL